MDYVAGTSMGAVVGALYAMGKSPEDIEGIVEEIDWDTIFRDAPRCKERRSPRSCSLQTLGPKKYKSRVRPRLARQFLRWPVGYWLIAADTRIFLPKSSLAHRVGECGRTARQISSAAVRLDVVLLG